MATVQRRVDDVLDNYRKPETDAKHVGIELEFSSPIPMEDLAKELVHLNFDKYCSLHNDGGHYENEDNIELAMVIPQAQMKTKFLQLGQMLSELGCKFHSGSGFHVHLDMRYRNPAKAFMNLVNTQDILFAIADKVRKSGDAAHWCGKVKHTALGGVGDDDDDYGYGDGGFYDYDSKSMAISPHLSSSKNTIEVRIRESCVDGLEIYNWVRLLCTIVDAPYIMKKVKTIKELEQNVRLAEGIREYIQTKFSANKKRD